MPTVSRDPWLRPVCDLAVAAVITTARLSARLADSARQARWDPIS